MGNKLTIVPGLQCFCGSWLDSLAEARKVSVRTSSSLTYQATSSSMLVGSSTCSNIGVHCMMISDCSLSVVWVNTTSSICTVTEKKIFFYFICNLQSIQNSFDKRLQFDWRWVKAVIKIHY